MKINRKTFLMITTDSEIAKNCLTVVDFDKSTVDRAIFVGNCEKVEFAMNSVFIRVH